MKLYKIKWRGFSGRVHKLKGKLRKLRDGTFVDKEGYGLPPAVGVSLNEAQYHSIMKCSRRK